MTIDGHAERIWRCTCGGSHFVSVSAGVGGFDDEGTVYLHVEEYPEAGHWGRLRACWSLLRHRRHTWCELLLTPDQAAAVAHELTHPPTRTEED